MELKFSFTSRTVDQVVIIDCEGYFNQPAGEQISDFCYKKMGGGEIRFLLNFEKSPVMNSIGVSALIEIIGKLRPVGGKIGYINLSPIVAKTFKIMGLLNHSKIYSSETDALLFLNS